MSKQLIKEMNRKVNEQEYDELILFSYANGRCCIDTYKT